MNKTVLTGVFLSGLLTAMIPVTTLHADYGRGKKGPHEFSVDEKVERMTKKLDLTSEQQSSIRTILEDKKSKMQSLHEQMKTLQDETQQKIDAVLTAEQKAKHEEMKNEGKEKMKKKKK